jgi:hypothetical protein
MLFLDMIFLFLLRAAQSDEKSSGIEAQPSNYAKAYHHRPGPGGAPEWQDIDGGNRNSR